jgi:ATP-dependent helicase/nuclease subunit A
MPEPRLTLHQQLACDLKRNLYVCAGAGSGKTEVLTRRAIHILKQHKLDLSRLLVVTFTDKAAGQMRARVYQAIQQQLSLEDEHQAYWLRLKENFCSNYISTFHSFCASILREYAVEARLDPDFSILNEHEQQDLLARIVNREIDRLAGGVRSDTLNRLSRVWRRDAIAAKVISLIEARSQAQEWLTRFAGLSLEEYMARLEDYRKQAIAEQIDELMHSRLFGEYLDTLDSLWRQLEHKTRTEVEKLAQIGALYPQLKQLSRLSTDAGVELLARLAEQLDLRGLKNQELKDTLKGLRELLGEYQILDYNLEPALEQQGYELLSALADLTQQCLRVYQQQKQSSASLDFEDLQLLTLQLLQDGQHPHICSELQARFRYIMVDEFQDTNPLQWQIIKILASDAQGLCGDKLFMVGDEKQSIYAFRGADVTVFAQAQAELRQANLNRNTHRLPFDLSPDYAADYGRLDTAQRNRLLQGAVTLGHNFRSAQGVIDFLNPFFQQIFQREHYRLYDAQAQPQTCERRFPGARVELMLVEKKAANSCNSQEDEPPDDYLKEAHLIAKKIKHILRERPREYSRVLEQMDQGESAIAILLARRNKIKVYEEALRREEIDFLVSKGRGFYQRQETKDIINALEFINQPQLDIPLAGVLRSPLVGLSDDGLLALTALAGRNLWDKLCFLFSEQQPSNWPAGFLPRDMEILPQAFQRLRNWIGLKDRLPLSELISKILDDSQFYICLARGQRGAQALANMEKLIESALDFEASGKGGIWEWINFLKLRFQHPVQEGEAEVEPALGGAVQLMTIHQAKGLEFPLVFIPDLSFPFQGGRGDDLPMDNLGDGKRCAWEVGIQAPDPNEQFKPRATLLRKIIARQRKQKDLAERRRLLYVAATRAQDHLILVGQISSKPPSRAGCWQDWIRNILKLDPLAELRTVSITGQQGKQINIPLTLFDPQEEISPYQESPIIRLEQIDEQVERLAASNELDSIIRCLEPLPVVERPLFSPTSLIEYRRCPRRYYYRHHLGIPEWVLGGAPASFVRENPAANLATLKGIIVHNLMETGIFEDSFIETKINEQIPEELSAEQYQALRKRVKQHINNILNNQDYQHWYQLKQKSYQELEFKLEVGDFYLQGSIDQLHFDPQLNEWIVVDYKTNELADEAEIKAEIEQKGYEFQLKCYCWAASRLLAQPVLNARLFFSCFPKLVNQKFSAGALEDFRIEIEDLGHKIMNQEFDPSPDKEQCRDCSYCQVLADPPEAAIGCL